MKKALALLLALLMLLAFAACTATPPSEAPATPDVETPATPDPEPAAPTITKVGVSMPTQSLQRWNQDGANMKEQLEAAGFEVDLQFAGDNEIPLQISQIENMIAGGCQVLVIAAIEGEALTTVLAPAKEKGIDVIAYDRLIKNSDAVTYYASFDNYKVGLEQGKFIVNALDLENAAGPFNIELFTGDPGDNNVNFFFPGAMEALQPFIDSGKLVVKSGQVTKEQVATEGWSTENAQKRMENLIAAQSYSPTGTPLAAVMSSNDSIAQGLVTALSDAGFKAENMPVITGQDCDIASTKNIINGTQAMSIFKDTRTLAAQVVKMIQSLATGAEPELNNTTDYLNGLKDEAGKEIAVPSFLCDPTPCTKDNYKVLLIDSGYYTEDQLKAD